MALLPNLVSYWKMEEASGTRADAVTATGNDLTDVNTVTQAAGIVGNAGHFVNANAEYLSRADNASWLVNAFSYSFWAKHTTLILQNYLSKDNGAGQSEFFFLYNGGPGFHVWNQAGTASGILSSGVLSASVWHHIVGTWDLATMKLYIDNAAPVSQGFVGTSIFNSTTAFEVGRGQALDARCFDGDLDEIGFWNRAITAGEVSTLFNGGAGLTFPFGEGGSGGKKSGFRTGIRIGL